MPTRHERLRYYQNQAKAAADKLKAMDLADFSEDRIWTILIYELDSWDVPTDIIFKGLDSEKIVQMMLAYHDRYGEAVTGIRFFDTILPDECFADVLEKATIKVNGEVWIIYAGDKDPFPSSPHAHNYDAQLKVDLGSGGLYRKRELTGKMRIKELMKLREKIKERLPSLTLPPLTR